MSLFFSMPYNGKMEIRPSEPIDELEVGMDEEIEGVVYQIFWNDNVLPWHTKTRLQATAIALGCQWGARKIFESILEQPGYWEGHYEHKDSKGKENG